MEINTQEITLRQLIPDEGKVIRDIRDGNIYPDGLYLGKEEDADNFIEIDPPEEEPEEAEE